MLKFLLDFFPLLAFFGGYQLAGMKTAVIALMVGMLIQTIGHRVLSKKWHKMHIFGTALAIVFGLLTIWQNNNHFIQWKVSIVFWVQAGIFLTGLAIKKSASKKMLEAATETNLGEHGRLFIGIDLIWAFVSILAGFANLYVAYNLSEQAWVYFKFIGVIVIYIGLFMYTLLKVYPYLPVSSDNDSEPH